MTSEPSKSWPRGFWNLMFTQFQGAFSDNALRWLVIFPVLVSATLSEADKEGFVGLLDNIPGMTGGIWQHRPESTGYVRAQSADPFVDPNPVDIFGMTEGVIMFTRTLGASAANSSPFAGSP